MPEHDNTNNLTPQLLMDCEDWEVAFEPYEGHPSDALTLGCKLGVLRAYLDAQTIKCRQAIKALDLALEVLFPFTSFHTTSFDVFIKYTEGKLTFEEEQMLNGLGVKFIRNYTRACLPEIRAVLLPANRSESDGLKR